MSGPVASGFNTAAYLSWWFPLAPVVIVWIWWLLTIRRREKQE